MTEKDRIVMATFEEKLHRLVYEHKQLEEANRELSRILEEKENTLNDLKQAKIISLTAEGIDGTKERISRLVREIDRCIESLKK